MSMQDAEIKTVKIGESLDGRNNVDKEPHTFEELPPEVRELLVKREARNKEQKKTSLKVLEQKHVLSLILYLDKMSPVLKTDIYNDISRCTNMLEKLEGLRSIGLVEIYNTGRTNSNIIVITEKGRGVAKLIGELKTLIETE